MEMTQTNRRLLIAIIILALIPQALRFIGITSPMWLIWSLFALNLLISFYGAKKSKHPMGWLVYAAASVISLFLFGMVSPISLFLLFLTRF